MNQSQINFRDKPLIDELREGGHLLDTRKLLILELQIADFLKQPERRERVRRKLERDSRK